MVSGGTGKTDAGRSRKAAGSDVDEDPESMAREIVQRRLAAAPQTRAQLDQAMVKKNVPGEVRERVLDRFAELNLIDDAAFAEAWVESRHAGRGLARQALGHELRQRGVEPALVDEAVAALPAEREEQMARELVAKRLPSTRRLEPEARMRRLLGMLARKGYPQGVAYRVVREALEAEGVDDESLPEPQIE